MEIRINLSLKKFIIFLIAAFICYIGVVKYLTFNKLSMMDTNCQYIIQAINTQNDDLFQKNKYFLGTNGYSMSQVVSLDIFKSEENVFLWNKIDSWLSTTSKITLSTINKSEVLQLINSYSKDIQTKKESYFLSNISSVIAMLVAIVGLFLAIKTKSKDSA